ncbi:MAG TPA: M15 family metallopeptidase [bacterium]|nr:M15 family metallopeptidase [bacterium]
MNVKDVIPDILLDIRYATPNNFTGKVLYPSADCFLAKEVALALKDVQEDLKKQGYCLKIFDGYRPLSVQKEMWKALPDKRYVANPEKGSVHNRGYAVDLTIVKLNGTPVTMPTDFDEFSIKAQSDYKDLPPLAIKHREILQKTMMKYGFIPIKTEWWHFNYPGYKNKPVLDISFGILKIRR